MEISHEYFYFENFNLEEDLHLYCLTTFHWRVFNLPPSVIFAIFVTLVTSAYIGL